MTQTNQDVDLQEVAQLDAEIQVEGTRSFGIEEPDPRKLYPLLRKTLEAYAEMLYGEGIYKVSFTLDPLWVAKVTVEAYGDLKTNVDPEFPDEGTPTLDPEHLGSFELIGDQACEVGF